MTAAAVMLSPALTLLAVALLAVTYRGRPT